MCFTRGNVLLSDVNETMYLLGNLPFFKIHVNHFMAWDAEGSLNQMEFINSTGSVSEQGTFERLLIRSCWTQRWFIKLQNFSKAQSHLDGILLTSSLKLDVTLSVVISSPLQEFFGRVSKTFPCPLLTGGRPYVDLFVFV